MTKAPALAETGTKREKYGLDNSLFALDLPDVLPQHRQGSCYQVTTTEFSPNSLLWMTAGLFNASKGKHRKTGTHGLSTDKQYSIQTSLVFALL